MNNKEKVEQFFFLNPTTQIHLRELARLTKLNPATIIKLTNELEKEKLITINKTNISKNLLANYDSKYYREQKIIFNLKSLYNSGIISYLENALNPECISIIGSYRRGEDMESSDIDLVIINPNNKKIDLSKYEKILKRNIQPLRIKYSDISQEFNINLINGIILNGFIDETI